MPFYKKQSWGKKKKKAVMIMFTESPSIDLQTIYLTHIQQCEISILI